MGIEDASGDQVKVYFELADVSGDEVVTEFPLMRLCLALEDALEGNFLADIRRKVITLRILIARRLGTAAVQAAAEWHSQTLIKELCDLAISDENCFYMSKKTWLKMTVSLKNPGKFFGELFHRDELTKSITIRRNVVPREGYLKKLQELHWPREFYSSRVLQEPRGMPLMQILRERRNSGNRACELAQELAQKLAQERTQKRARRKPVFHTVRLSAEGQWRKLGEGAGGVVREVVWGNCSYAVKILDPFKKGNFEIEKNFAESGLGLHPHIVQVFGGSKPVDPKSEANRFLLMELLDNNLLRFFYQSITRGPRISRVEKLDLLFQIASAISKLHKNKVVHGDLKLENILISTFEVSGDVRHLLAKVADFDTNVQIKPRAVDTAPRSRGTVRYASPELLRGHDVESVRVDCQSDVYSFGVMAYELLTEHWAYDLNILTEEELSRSGDSDDNDNKEVNVAVLPSVVRKLYAAGDKKLIDCTAWRDLRSSWLVPEYSEEVVTLVERCLEFNPGERPESSEILKNLTRSKSKLQTREKKIADKRKNLIRGPAKLKLIFLFVIIAVLVIVIIAVLVSLLHTVFASVALMVVILVASACYTGNWPCFNFLTTFPAEILN